jgi:hypothetical protein
MANIRASRTTDLVGLTTNIKRDVYEAIFNFKPYQTPIQQFFMANKSAKYGVMSPKFELQEDVLVSHSFTNPTAYSSAGTTISSHEFSTFAASCGLKYQSMIYNTATNQLFRITSAITTGTTADLILVSSGTITSWTTSDTILVIGSGYAEGEASSDAISTVVSQPYNYTQIHKKAVQMSGTMMSTATYGGNDWVNQRTKATEEIKLELERSWWYGVRNAVTTAGAYVRTSGGILDDGSIGVSNRDQFTGTTAPSEDYFFKTFCKNAFAKGTNRKTFYAGADMLLAVNDFSKVKQQTAVSESEYGVDIKRILTPFGQLDMVWHPLFEGSMSTWGVALDRDNYLKYAYLNGNGVSRDLQYQTDIGTVGSDLRKDQYLAEVGLHMAGGGQGVHRVLYPGA